jgi:hypothetical protein
MIDFQKLRAPFPADRVSWRVGPTNRDKTKGMALAYVDARDIQDRLDDVCGPENWQNRYPHANGKTVCEIGIRVGDDWVWKSDGAGDTDMEAEKGALSDAFKRAAVKWGLARYLYDIESPWVKITEQKQIDPSEMPRLRRLLEGAPAPAPRPAAGPVVSFPDGTESLDCESVTAWLDLYEEAAKRFGHGDMWEMNDAKLSSFQAKAAKAGVQEIVDRIKRLYIKAQHGKTAA